VTVQTNTSPRARFRLPTAVVAGGVATLVLMATYLSTAAPDLTFWDATEFMTAAHTLGIPHPPGTPLWVLLANATSRLFSNAGPARAVTMLSVLASALAGGAGAALAARWIGGRAAVVSAVMAGTMYSVWNNATETEVYGVVLLVSIAMLAAGEVAGRHDTDTETRRRARALLAFLAALAVPLHLSVLVALPAAITLAWRGPRPTARDLLAWGALALLALSAVALLPLFSARHPALDSGHPDTLRSLIAVLRREQYAVPGLWPRQAPLWLQLGNVFQWADWQVAFGVHPFGTPSLVRTSLTVIWAWLGVLGLRALFTHEARVGRGMLVLLASGLLGVALWLNLKAGPTFGAGVLPPGAAHEARERDYFFVLGFWAWGMLAGAGLAALVAPLSRLLPRPIALLPLTAAAVPLLLNRAPADRTREPVSTLPRSYARLLLDAVPEHGVLVSAGDNDTFPLWYLQQVEGYRPDVTVVTVPLLGADWYRAQLADQSLLDVSAVRAWPGLDVAMTSVMRLARREGRAVRVSTLLARADRVRLDTSLGWLLEGLVYRPAPALTPGSTGLDPAAMRKAHALVPNTSLQPLPPGADPAAATAQELLRCTAITTLTDPLLVSGCNGF
jgi:hypothetical protein